MLCRLLSVKRSAYYDWRAAPSKVVSVERLIVRRRAGAASDDYQKLLKRHAMVCSMSRRGVIPPKSNRVRKWNFLVS